MATAMHTHQHSNDKSTQAIDIPSRVRKLRATFDEGRTRTLAWRTRQLEGIARFLDEREQDILNALATDLGKPALEAFLAEVAYTKSELVTIKKKLKSWMKPERVSTSMLAQPGRSAIHREPLGVVLIIGPWNYPFQLVMGPLVGAIAAGNCAIVKPSEVASATSKLLAQHLPAYIDGDAIAVIEGGVAETTALLEQKFDHIFYTGNGAVGRIVMTAAAKHLTPVTLELGGKSPCIVDEHCDLDVTVKRILWGKFYNAGQTCVAPDYLLVHEKIEERLIAKLKETLKVFYGDDPQQSPDYGRVVNARHHKRLMKMLGSGEVVVGGQADEATRYLAPTILRKVSPDSPAMAEEIFGPILPVLTVKSIDEAIAFVNARPKPLALYVFTRDSKVHEEVLARTSSGGATVNHTWVHLTVSSLPFGGVGESGMGAYHGKATFETFSHHKSVLVKSTKMDAPILYPPYDASKKKWLKRLV